MDLENQKLNVNLQKHRTYVDIKDDDDDAKYTWNYNDYANATCSIRTWRNMSSCYEKGTVSSDYNGNNVICCNGHILMGPLTQLPMIFLTLTLTLIPVAIHLWIIYKVYYIKLNDIISYSIILFVLLLFTFISIYYLFKTYLTDPGIIPRNNNPIQGPLNEYDRFCTTCNVIRSAKAKHCTLCNNCVNGFDHHCPWVGTCVAERNLFAFVAFVFHIGLLGLISIIICLINWLVGKVGTKGGFGMLNTIILIYSVIFTVMLLPLTANYICMIGNGMTTNERILYGEKRQTSAERAREINTPLTNSFYSNVYAAFCSTMTPSDVFD